MKKVLIITYYWPPSGGAGVQRWLKFAKYLPEFGFEPVILTVDPLYASYPQKDESLTFEIPTNTKVFYTKTFELYNLYKFFLRKKEIPYGGFANEKETGFSQKIIRILRSHLLIPDPRKGWNNYAFKKATEIIKELKIDSVITTSPPHSTQLIGLRLQKKLQVCWIADLRDPWTDIFYYKSLYHSPISFALDKRLERKVISNANCIITVSNSLKNIFLSKEKNLNRTKFYVIPNGFDTDDFKQIIQPNKNEFIITYTGTLNADYTIDTLFRVISDLILEGLKLKIRFIGKIPASLLEKKKIQPGLMQNIEILGYVPHYQSIKFLLESNALLLIIPNVKHNNGILTGKLFEYIGSKKPIIGIGPVNSDAAAIIEETKSGKMIDYYDVKELRQTILDYYNGFTSGNTLITENTMKYSRYELTGKLAGIMNSLIS